MKIQKQFIYSIFIVTLLLGCFALLPNVQAVVPAPDGGYPGFTTAEGTNALKNLTSGVGNTAAGWYSLFTNSTGNLNTGVGAGTLALNNADENTAIGAGAMFIHSTGNDNTANGAFALSSDTNGQLNTAIGARALFSNITGGFNTAIGGVALGNNTTGGGNTAIGTQALYYNTTGSANTALGVSAGANLTTGDNNIDIGNLVFGNAGEANTIRIGQQGTQTATYIAGIFGTNVTGSTVVVDSTGQLGVAASSQRFKKAIEPMDKASEAILSLNPVTFEYKDDSGNTPQFGLIAEQVAEVNPNLVVRDQKGKVYTVRYEAVNAMLLNEFLKEHRAFVEQQQKTEKQQKEIDALKAELKEQRSLIQKVSDKVELKTSAPQALANNP